MVSNAITALINLAHSGSKPHKRPRDRIRREIAYLESVIRLHKGDIIGLEMLLELNSEALGDPLPSAVSIEPLNGDVDTSFNKRLRDRISTKIADMQSAINHAKREIIASKRLLNLTSPIGRLPPELLIVIFLFLAIPEHEGCCHHHDPSWINITFVCSQWRSIALDCSSIWGRPAAVSPAFALECALPRSKATPIHLHLFDPSELFMWKDVLDRVFRQDSRRLRSLILVTGNTPGPSLHELLGEASGPDAAFPSLERLELCGPDEIGIPSSFLKGPTGTLAVPSLVDLTLVDTGVTWSRMPFTAGMHTLRLVTRGDEQPPRPSVTEFLDALKLMPRLRDLALDEFLPAASSSNAIAQSWSKVTLGSRCCSLGQLVRLELNDSVANVTQFHLLVKVPRAKNLTVRCTDDPLGRKSLGPLLRSIKGSWPAMGKLKVAAIRTSGMVLSRGEPVPDDLGQQFGFEFGHPALTSSSSSSTLWEESLSLDKIHLSLSIKRGFTLLSDTFSNFRKVMDLTAVSSLAVYQEPRSMGDWVGVYGTMESVTCISVGDPRSLRGFLCAIRNVEPRWNGEKASFPALESLVIDGFLNSQEDELAAARYGVVESTAELVYTCLERRSWSPWPIRELSICNCTGFWSEEELGIFRTVDGLCLRIREHK